MTITSLELTNFRSYASAQFQLHPQVTLVVGPNASGKTNLLESLFVLSTTKSFRAKDRDLVRHGEDFFRLLARSSDHEVTFAYSIAGGVQEKRISLDDTRQTLLSHIGTIQVVLFEPTDLDLVSGAPEGRRRYLDFLLSQTDRRYLKTLQDYRRVLKQRNALLEAFKSHVASAGARDELFAWDVKLTELAADIYTHRQRLVQALNMALPQLYADIAGSAAEISLEYLPTVAGHDYAQAFMDALVRNFSRDVGAGFTTIGPHREDFAVQFKGTAITSVASRGETRTAVLACKLAELDYAEAVTGTRPLLLLDDVFSELDRDRRTFLLGRLQGYQTVITTTDADAITREFKTPHSVLQTAEPSHV